VFFYILLLEENSWTFQSVTFHICVCEAYCICQTLLKALQVRLRQSEYCTAFNKNSIYPRQLSYCITVPQTNICPSNVDPRVLKTTFFDSVYIKIYKGTRAGHWTMGVDGNIGAIHRSINFNGLVEAGLELLLLTKTLNVAKFCSFPFRFHRAVHRSNVLCFFPCPGNMKKHSSPLIAINIDALHAAPVQSVCEEQLYIILCACHPIGAWVAKKKASRATEDNKRKWWVLAAVQ